MQSKLKSLMVFCFLLCGFDAHGHSTGMEVPVKVMSFNIRFGTANDGDNHWDRRADLVVETIRLFDPDLLGAQEVLEFQAEFLKDHLPGYTFHGVGREDGKTTGEYVPIWFRKDRFQLIESGHFWLSTTPEIAGSKSWDSSLPRMVSWVQLEDLKNDHRQFVFLNTHFDHVGQEARVQSARLIRERAGEFLKKKGLPVIISGDFNATEDDAPYRELTGQSSRDLPVLIDSYRQANPVRQNNESTSSRWNGNREGSRIDWILHSDAFATIDSVINHLHDGPRYPSDHYPVQAVLRIRRIER